MARQKKNNYSDIASVPREAVAAVGVRRILSSCCGAGLDPLEPGRWTERQINKIVYVAVTRARQRLFIPYCFENSLIQRIVETRNDLLPTSLKAAAKRNTRFR